MSCKIAGFAELKACKKLHSYSGMGVVMPQLQRNPGKTVRSCADLSHSPSVQAFSLIGRSGTLTKLVELPPSAP